MITGLTEQITLGWALAATALHRVTLSPSSPASLQSVRTIMSFGYAVGDFVSVGKLAWDLYHKCFLGEL